LKYASNADYIAWLDADDAYSLDFLEKMIAFAAEYQLDIAGAGYDVIDDASGELIKRRVPSETLVLEGRDFVDRFPEYRSFTTTVWGKIYSIPFFRQKSKLAKDNGYFLYSDSLGTLAKFEKAERAGIYAESMYQYYRHPSSASASNLPEAVKGYRQYWHGMKDFLKSYGPISKVNEDFLYAVYLSLVDEYTERVFSSDLLAAKKLELLRMIFQEPLWAETLARDADPQFRNLAGRREYVARMKERILALANTAQEKILAEIVVRELDKPIVGASA